ncbi:MAG: hypothetical protein FJ271_17405 [Planctomycetes bacterium]|nr:hypothetical protein [Planctomycetota bacterium]
MSVQNQPSGPVVPARHEPLPWLEPIPEADLRLSPARLEPEKSAPPLPITDESPGLTEDELAAPSPADMEEMERQQREHAGRVARCAERIMHMCPDLIVTFEDAQASGYCETGIRDFTGKWGMAQQTTAAALRATGDKQALLAIEAAARRLAIERVLKGEESPSDVTTPSTST